MKKSQQNTERIWEQSHNKSVTLVKVLRMPGTSPSNPNRRKYNTRHDTV